ncbi:MAG TPA: hypothetical protein VF219_15230 [Vicinamibacterales bacterium]
MPLRVGFDIDGVLADFGSAYREVERALLGDVAGASPSAPEDDPAPAAERDAVSAAAGPRNAERRRRVVWDRIRATQNFWTTLKATEPDAIRQLHALMIRHQWEVVFITQRPATAGDTVQRQTQRWLVQQGFDIPSVLVVAGSRGAAIHALRLTHHVDDSPQNCVDVKSDSSAMPILIVTGADQPTARQARKLGISVAASLQECFEILEGASRVSTRSSPLRRLAALVS